MDKFVLIAPGNRDSDSKSVVRVTPSCYQKVEELKRKTGLSMCRILEQCVDFALDHMVEDDE